MEYNTPEYFELNTRTHQLMNRMRNCEGFYAPHVHNFLQKEYLNGVGECNRDTILPMPKEKWHPKNKAAEWLEYYSAVGMKWPEHTQLQYSMDTFQSTAPGILHFGYGICADGLFPCAFMVHLLMTLKIESSEGLAPQEYAMDPIALYAGKNPDGYIGVAVPKEYIENWIVTRDKTKIKHPLEYYVDERNK